MVYKKLALVFFLAMMSIAMTGCEKKHLFFSITNLSSDSIAVRYYPIGTTDTTLVQMAPGPQSGYPSYQFISKTEESTSLSWNNIYDLHIESITNSAGDTINFDPNVSTNWKYGGSANHDSYLLEIYDNAF